MRKLEEEAMKEQQRLEMIKRASSDAKQRYQSLQNKMQKASTKISLHSKDQIN